MALDARRKDDEERIARVRRKIQDEVIDRIDSSQLQERDDAALRKELAEAARGRLETIRESLNKSEQDRIIAEVVDNLLGLGPLEVLVRDPAVSDILINGPDNVFVDRGGKLQKTDVRFDDNVHLMQIIERIVVAVGRRVDEQNPMVDARMKDGSRFNAIIAPLSLDGAAVSIRRFGTKEITAEDLVRFNSCPRPMMTLLQGIVKAGKNTIISGGTGSGKTTLLNVLSNFIPADERVITIEDSAELQLQIPHVVRLETRPANVEGKGQIEQRDLVRNSLRMRPDRIILGEIRGGEAVDMLTAMMTGQEGSLATVHANTTRDALARFETMVGIGMPNLTPRAIRETIARALDVIIQQQRLPDGTRRVLAITEVTGLESNVITTQDVFVFDQETIDEEGRVRGKFRATGVRPRFLSKLAMHGIHVDPAMWEWELRI